MEFFVIGCVAAVGYCLLRGIADLRARRYAWAAFGILSAVVFALAPLEMHSVETDFPANADG